MDWSPECARNAYLDTLKLCNKLEENCDTSTTAEPESKEFISALAAGMNAKLIVEVTPEASSSTIALAAAARQTGGKLVCILPKPRLDESQKVIDESGLNDMVEFKTGDPVELLPNYENIDFSLVDCKTDNYTNLLGLLDVNPTKSVVVADNLVEGRKGLEGHVKGMENKGKVRSMKHPIGKGMEVTMIGKSNEVAKKHQSKGGHSRARGGSGRRGGGGGGKSKWVIKVDEKSGEEHFFRMP
ncbi:uncharacterized protein LOC130753227 [Actinidia eriantha]|uniref:uncharacterized protein LOC130753227 n=1 Tax=Actinidia eriantha TaxID=165200 RepID=UPI00258D22E2|nr:uncharacterized protein LOC130753227 [Actinidia eriantha]